MSKKENVEAHVRSLKEVFSLFDNAAATFDTLTVGKVQNKMARRLLKESAREIRYAAQDGLRLCESILINLKIGWEHAPEMDAIAERFSRIKAAVIFDPMQLKAINNGSARMLLADVTIKITHLAETGIILHTQLADMLVAPEEDNANVEVDTGSVGDDERSGVQPAEDTGPAAGADQGSEQQVAG